MGHTCGLPTTGTMGTGIPWVQKWLPVKLPIPMVWVWVFMGKGMGKVKNTHGLPMQNTNNTHQYYYHESSTQIQNIDEHEHEHEHEQGGPHQLHKNPRQPSNTSHPLVQPQPQEHALLTLLGTDLKSYVMHHIEEYKTEKVKWTGCETKVCVKGADGKPEIISCSCLASGN